ncbi:MAG TPA: family 43 glycosylhydrolase, partial [Caulobacteraceae bacterium]
AFFRLHPLIEAAAEDFPAFRRRLGRLAADIELPPDLRALATEALAASVTRILARRLADDGTSLIGETTVVLVNDQVWEAHLVEGVWVQKIGGTHHLFYAANDFSNARYGVGVATADHPLGPYAKAAEPFIQSSADWVAPGHPSVTINAAGEPQMFLHAFPPGRAGYKAFRALMTARLALRGGRLELAP